MKRKGGVVILICVLLLALGLYAGRQLKGGRSDPVPASPAASPTEETAPASRPGAQAPQAETDAGSVQTDETAGEPEGISAGAGVDIILPELEIPTAPPEVGGAQSGSRPADETPQGGAGDPAPQEEEPDPQDTPTEQGGVNGIVIDDNGNILLPELP